MIDPLRHFSLFRASPTAARPAPRTARVLIVDASRARAVARHLARLFTSWGHEVRVARTWDDGLRQATAAAPDVLVVDRGSRNPGSLSPVRLIRLLPGLKRTPIIVVRNRVPFLLDGELGAEGGESSETRDLQPLAAEGLWAAVSQPAG